LAAPPPKRHPLPTTTKSNRLPLAATDQAPAALLPRAPRLDSGTPMARATAPSRRPPSAVAAAAAAAAAAPSPPAAALQTKPRRAGLAAPARGVRLAAGHVRRHRPRERRGLGRRRGLRLRARGRGGRAVPLGREHEQAVAEARGADAAAAGLERVLLAPHAHPRRASPHLVAGASRSLGAAMGWWVDGSTTTRKRGEIPDGADATCLPRFRLFADRLNLGGFCLIKRGRRRSRGRSSDLACLGWLRGRGAGRAGACVLGGCEREIFSSRHWGSRVK